MKVSQRKRMKSYTRGTVEPEGYSNYINSSAWKEVRKNYIEDRKPTSCSACGGTWGHGDHIHHMTYKNLGNEYLDDLIHLCEACHRELHEYDTTLKERAKSKRKRHQGLYASTQQFCRRKQRESRVAQRKL